MESVGKSGRPLYTKESLKRGSGMGEPQCTSEVELSLIQSGRKDSNCSRRKLIVNQKPGLETVSQLLIITLRKQIKVSNSRHFIKVCSIEKEVNRRKKEWTYEGQMDFVLIVVAILYAIHVIPL